MSPRPTRMDVARAQRYGFKWGQVLVTRLAEVKRRTADKEPYRIIQVNDLTIYVTPSGLRTRVFRNNKELKEVADATPGQRDGVPDAATPEAQPATGGRAD